MFLSLLFYLKFFVSAIKPKAESSAQALDRAAFAAGLFGASSIAGKSDGSDSGGALAFQEDEEPGGECV